MRPPTSSQPASRVWDTFTRRVSHCFTLLQLPENTAIFLEKDDDLDFIDGDGGKSLGFAQAQGDRR